MTDQAIKSADDRFDIEDVERRIKAIFIGSIGNLVEWYDFYAYTAFALYFAPAFFPNSDPVVQQLNAAVLFAATFLMRPLGGWLFGFIADRHGRRLSLPCGFTASGLPVGLQVVAPPRGEAKLLAGSKVLEDILGVRDTTPIDPRPPK
jgi:MFS family permease